jgi:hypothetical protein
VEPAPSATAGLSFGYATQHGGPYLPIAGSPPSTGNPLTPFSANISALESGKTYYFEARSTVGSDVVTGLEMSFLTEGFAPTLNSLNPNTGVVNTILSNVIFRGTNLTNSTLITFSGAGIALSQQNFVNTTQITATLTISAGAAIGSRNITVSNASSRYTD